MRRNITASVASASASRSNQTTANNAGQQLLALFLFGINGRIDGGFDLISKGIQAEAEGGQFSQSQIQF
jgi:hypothetical protein